MSEAESVNVPQRTELFHVVNDAVGPMERCGDERGAASATWVESVSIDIAILVTGSVHVCLRATRHFDLE